MFLYTIKKDVDNSNILKRSLTSLKINSKSYFINNQIEKLLSIWPIFKKIVFSLDNNLDDKDLNKIKVLIINVLLTPFIAFNIKNSKIFFFLLGFIEKAKEMTTNLANRLFNYIFILICNILSCNISLINTSCNIIDLNLYCY